MSFFKELKRRNVLRAAAAYIIVSWLAIQVAETIFPLFGFDDTPARIVVIVLAVGFLPAMVVSWAFELTTKGFKRDSGVRDSTADALIETKKFDRIIMAILALALAYFAFDKFVLDPQSDARQRELTAQQVEKARQAGRIEGLVESYGDLSIAVLPFANLSGDSNNDYFSDGMSEELLNLLAKIPQLRVISRTSAFSFKDKDMEIPEIAEDLGVAHILEGSVRMAGDRVRITAQLIDARSDMHLWSETYDRTLDDIFSIQDQIANAIVEKLKVSLLKPIPTQTVTDPETYALYLQALQQYRLFTNEGHSQALEILQQAVKTSPDYANAWALMAQIYLGSFRIRLFSPEEGVPLATDAVRRALKLDQDNSIAHTVMIELSLYVNHDMHMAVTYLRTAMASGRVDTNLINAASALAQGLGDLDESFKILQYAIARDPMNAIFHRELSLLYYYQGKYQEAMTSAQTALMLNPTLLLTHGRLAAALFFLGRKDEALKEADLEIWPEFRYFCKAMGDYWLGDEIGFQESMKAMEENATPGAAWKFYALSYIGENEHALDWLETHQENLDISWLLMASNGPQMATMRKEPRYLAVLRSFNMAPEQISDIHLDLDLPD